MSRTHRFLTLAIFSKWVLKLGISFVMEEKEVDGEEADGKGEEREERGRGRGEGVWLGSVRLYSILARPSVDPDV